MASTSKNNRKLIPSGGGYVEVGEPSRLVPLGANHCYMRDPRSPRIHHVKVNTEQFNTLLDEFITVVGSTKILAELDRLSRTHPAHGWALVAQRIRAAA
jgi:hypothetical protein